jgi:hypothetical protein
MACQIVPFRLDDLDAATNELCQNGKSVSMIDNEVTGWVKSVRLKKPVNKMNDYTVLRVDRNKAFLESESNACPFGKYLLHFSGNYRLNFLRQSHKSIFQARMMISYSDSRHQSCGSQNKKKGKAIPVTGRESPWGY